MKKYLTVLQSVKLFKGIEPDNLGSMLACLGAKIIKPAKNEAVLLAGNKVKHVGMVLKGVLHIVKEDREGNRVLLGAVTPGNFFGEALCCAGTKESPVSVLAGTDAEVMLLEFRRILHICPSSCSHHTKLIENMLFVLADKNLELQARMDFLSKKTVHERVLLYLESESSKKGRSFTIPFNREELADFLSMDRTSLSRALAQLKEEGVIDYWKNRFTLL